MKAKDLRKLLEAIESISGDADVVLATGGRVVSLEIEEIEVVPMENGSHTVKLGSSILRKQER